MRNYDKINTGKVDKIEDEADIYCFMMIKIGTKEAEK